MSKIISCGIVPIRKVGNEIQILLCKPTGSGFFGMGFLKGQVENGEDLIETAKREFSEESGNLEVELIDEGYFFTQNNPKKIIHIWPAFLKQTDTNALKIKNDGRVIGHDDENEYIKFYSIYDLPVIFKNQIEIAESLINDIELKKINITD